MNKNHDDGDTGSCKFYVSSTFYFLMVPIPMYCEFVLL